MLGWRARSAPVMRVISGIYAPLLTLHCGDKLKRSPSLVMGPLQLSDHVVQTRQTGEQMTHWDMLNKATKFGFSFFNMAQCVICSPVWRFVPRDRSAAKGPLRNYIGVFFNDITPAIQQLMPATAYKYFI